MKKSVSLIVLVVVLALIGGVWYWRGMHDALPSIDMRDHDGALPPTPTPPLAIGDEVKRIKASDTNVTTPPNLQEIRVCGNIYQAPQILVSGVDVIRRLAEIGEDMGNPQYSCTIIDESQKDGVIVAEIKNWIKNEYDNNLPIVEDDVYELTLGSGEKLGKRIFRINVRTNTITEFGLDAFDRGVLVK